MSRLYRRSDVAAENKVAPMYQKKQATARQAKAVVDARPPISCESRFSSFLCWRIIN
jgi:hypothetical protein